MEIEKCIYGHLFKMKQDSKHYKAGDLVWSGDFTGMIPMTTDGQPPDPSIVEVSGYDENSNSTRPEAVHFEMLEYIGPAKDEDD